MMLPRSPLLVLALAQVAAAQAIHLIGPGGFAQIDSALAVAAPGDIILVPPGTWSGFTTNIGVTVRGTGPGVTVLGATANLPAGQTLHLIDLTVAIPFAFTITGGRANIDRCTLASNVVSSEVRFQSCTGTGFTFFSITKPGLDATNANITAIDSSFTGGQGVPQTALPSSHGIQLQGSTLLGSHLVVRGGDGFGGGSSNPKEALSATNSTVWTSDSTLTSGAFPGGSPSGCPVAVLGSTAGRLTRCTLNPVCTPPIPTSGPLLGTHRPQPLSSPAPFSLEFQTEPNALVSVYFAAGLGNVTLPGVEQPILLDLATVAPLELMVANTTGFATGTWTVPAGLTDATFWFQAVGTASPGSLLQTSPVAGGVVR